MADPKVSNILNFYCECCDYKCSKKQNYNKHLSTEKHKNINNNHFIIDIIIKYP